jgi:quinol monooxygenase YgiN
MMFGMISRITAQPGQRDALAALLAPGEGRLPGLLSYIVARDPKDADVLYVTEAWESRAAHSGSLLLAEVQTAMAKGRPLIAKFELIAETEPVGGVGLGSSYDNP